jgi:S1-C subfamily serine protease
MMKSKYALFVSVLALLALVLSGCSFPDLAALSNAPAASTNAADIQVAEAPAASVAQQPAAPVAAQSPETSVGAVAALEGTLEQVYTRVNPSVVNIQVRQTVSMALPDMPEIPGFSIPETPQQQEGLGSGFVWDAEGHIVTNNHVVDGADRIMVTFHDGTTIPGEVVGTDPDSDLAVVQVDELPEGITPLELADSSQVKVGELAIAIGNPFGLEGTMTLGIISAIGRSLPAQSGTFGGPTYSIPDVIQTDAPINPGNSGGVLVDDTGRVIGVTAAIESPIRANAGIGFAIPSNIVEQVVPALIETGRYEHAWLGISGVPMDPSLAEAMNLDAGQRGVLVVQVTPDSPAEDAGLRGSDQEATVDGQQVPVGGDIIVGIDGQEVKDFDDLVAYLARSTQAGQEVSLTLLRGGDQVQVDVTLAARPSTTASQAQAEPQQQQRTQSGAWLGITGLDLAPEIAAAIDLPSDQAGVLVQDVESGGPAEVAGVRGGDEALTIGGQEVMVGGDVIVALNGDEVDTIQALRSLLQQANPGQSATLTVLRDGQETELNIILGEPPAS